MSEYNYEANINDQLKQLINEALNLPSNAFSYFVSQKLASLFPHKALLEDRNNHLFDVEAFSKANLCDMSPSNYIYNQKETAWDEIKNKFYQNIKIGSFHVNWRDNQILLLSMKLKEGNCNARYNWILAEREEVAKSFFITVCETISKWYLQIEKEVFVFEGGYWSKDQELFESIQDKSFDNLILSGTLKQDFLNDITTFFAAGETYKNHNLAWQRNYLFIGSPGNGKSHTVKAVINQMQKPCLYVRSFESSEFYRRNSEENMRYVFKQARLTAPCILVLEDLDSLINARNRSFFLNQLDGFSSNHGVVILATTNHPERIDSAIIERPGRFDRKYYFELPAFPERVAYIELWQERWFDLSMRLSDAAIAEIAELTYGFSFAYLRELFIFSVKQSVNATASGTMEQVMISQINFLREQMSSSANKVAEIKSKSSRKSPRSIVE